MPEVKSTRRYDSSRRKAQARRNRERVLDAARQLFLDNGYATTTVASIANEASVSVETIYKAFGGKSGLVRAIYERGLLGRGPIPAYQRSDDMREQEADPRAIMREWGELTAEVSSLVTPIRLLIRSACEAEPEMRDLLDEVEDNRLTRMRHNARFLAERGYLRDDVSLDQATDILWTCSSAELYELLVLKRGWTRSRFAQFVAEFMTAALLGDSAGDGDRA